MEQVRYTHTGGLRRSSLRSRWSARLLIALVALAALASGAPTASAKPGPAAPACCFTTGLGWDGYVYATNETGVTISGLAPGQWYNLYVTGGSWQAQSWGGPLYYHGWVTNNGSTWYRMATGTDSQDVDLHWAEWVGPIGGGYFQMQWQATTTSIRFRVADAPGKFYDNSGILYLSLRPLD